MNREGSVLALTQGDPAGIGPDITLVAWNRHRGSTPAFAVLGDPALFSARAKCLGLDVPIREVDFGSASRHFATALPVVPVGHSVRTAPGTPSSTDAAATLASIEHAVAAVRNDQALAVVTNPVAKHVLYGSGFRHPGQTEFLEELARRNWGAAGRAIMLLWSEVLAVVPLTVHVPLADVPHLLTADLIVETTRTVARDMRLRFGIEHPRLVCAGLNPHAGENGSIGREEVDVIMPALERLRRDGLSVQGPLSADTMFHPEARAGYDVALMPYHDQALIPIKTLSFDTGVNVTLGLPFIRTSPDHGTAFALAGSGRANPSSLVAALGLAARLAQADRAVTT